MKLCKRINIYIAKSFCVKFFQIMAGFALMSFFINIMDIFEKVRGSDVPLAASAFMAFLQIPDFLNEIAPSLILISTPGRPGPTLSSFTAPSRCTVAGAEHSVIP